MRSTLDRLLKPRGNKLPAGSYDVDIGTVFSPLGPDGPIHFKARVYDACGEPLGKYVFVATPRTSFRVRSQSVGRAEALETLDASDHFVSVTLESPGELGAMVLKRE